MSKQMLIRPRVSEKAYAVSQVLNTYVFEVPASASKQAIAAAVGTQYNVTVKSVNVLVAKGKRKRAYLGRSKFVSGQRSDTRKAYVTLKQGDSIPLFTEVDAEAKAESDSAANKKTAKENK